jgi:hypothetical protein
LFDLSKKVNSKEKDGENKANRKKINRRKSAKENSCHQSSPKGATFRWWYQETSQVSSWNCVAKRDPKIPEINRTSGQEAAISEIGSRDCSRVQS